LGSSSGNSTGIIEANDEFLRIVGYDREDLASGRLRWTDLTSPERLDRDSLRWKPELITTGSLQPSEKEYVRKDGSRVPVLIGVASIETGSEGVAFVLDLTERKRAEAAAREMQLELAHANRVATMGQLTASIAHEVKQPITAVISNAEGGCVGSAVDR
jgi:PAS domain S-box-containing protein